MFLFPFRLQSYRCFGMPMTLSPYEVAKKVSLFWKQGELNGGGGIFHRGQNSAPASHATFYAPVK